MQVNQAWIEMFGRIPADLQDALALGLTTGAEIVVQKIVRVDTDFMIVRGRVSGTLDVGRTLFIPYSELVYVALARVLTDVEVETIFGKGAAPVVIALPPANNEASRDHAEPAAKDATVNDGPAEVNPAKKPAPLSKSALVARMRDRLKDSGTAGK